MSSAITRVGNSQVLKLHHKLIIGIRVDGTIVHLDTHQMHRIRPRPFLQYFAETLKNLQCDVTLFIPAPLRECELIWKRFTQRYLPLPINMVEDVLPDADERHSPLYRSSAAFSYNNYADYLHERARTVHSERERVLLIEDEISKRYRPWQTLILHKYRYLTPRQIRKLTSTTNEQRKENNTFDTNNSNESEESLTARELGLTPHTSRWEQYEHKERLQKELQCAQNTTNILNHEQLFTEAASANASYFNKRAAYNNLIRKKRAEQEEKKEEYAQNNGNSEKKKNMKESVCKNSNSSTSSDSVRENNSVEKDNLLESNSIIASTSHSSLPTLKLEDYTLIALSEMLTELASSEWTVREYLEREPLIEQLSVPSYGSAFYLPIENCDDMEPLNWEEITVVEATESNAATVNNDSSIDNNVSNNTTEPDANFFR